MNDSSNKDVAGGDAYLHAVLGTMVDSVISITPKGHIQTFNRAAERVFGYAAAEVIGHNVRILMPEPHHSAHDRYLKNYLTTGQAKIIGLANRELQAQRKDGSVFPIELGVSEVKAGQLHFFVGIIRDISERKKAEQALVDYTVQMESILATMIEGLITIDEDCIMHSFNPAAERIFGYAMEEVIGRNIKMLMPEPYHSEHDRYVSNYLTTGVPKVIGFGREVRAQCKNGEIFPMELAVSEMKVSGKRMFVGLVRDISARKHADEERDELINALKRSNQELDDFAYIASHDLKEPLRGLFNNALFLEEDSHESLDQGGRKRLDRMRYLCKHMEKLIDNLLYFSRIGRQDLAIRETDLNVLVEEQIDVLSEYAENAEIKIRGRLPSMACDYTRIAEVFHNLIANALKYNDKDSKVIEIGFLEKYQDKHDVFYVKDNGIGIAPEYHNAIFKIFKRLNEEDETKRGSGVGLTFVKKIIERYKGAIWLESNLGLGTTFYFTLIGESDE